MSNEILAFSNCCLYVSNIYAKEVQFSTYMELKTNFVVLVMIYSVHMHA